MKPILAAALIGLIAVSLALSQTKNKTIDSLAVLPFLNVGRDRKTEFLADEITKRLINRLSKLPNLRVVPYASILRYKGQEQVDPNLSGKGKAMNPQTVGNELGVQAVFYGRVIRRGHSLSVSAELVDVRENSLIWGNQYNRKLSDFVAVQEEMAHDISQKLRTGVNCCSESKPP